MTCRPFGAMPLPEPMTTQFPDAYMYLDAYALLMTALPVPVVSELRM